MIKINNNKMIKNNKNNKIKVTKLIIMIMLNKNKIK